MEYIYNSYHILDSTIQEKILKNKKGEHLYDR